MNDGIDPSGPAQIAVLEGSILTAPQEAQAGLRGHKTASAVPSQRPKNPNRSASATSAPLKRRPNEILVISTIGSDATNPAVDTMPIQASTSVLPDETVTAAISV